MRRKYVLWRYALVCERLRCEPWRPSHLSMVPRLRRGRHSCRALSHPLYLARSKLEVYPSCGRSLALARCHHGGSPRTSQRAPSSPRDALATPHPSKSNDRAPPPPASPCLPLRLRLRLALQPRTRARARACAARVRYREATLHASSEPGAKSSRLEPRTVQPPPLAVLQRHSRAVPHIT